MKKKLVLILLLIIACFSYSNIKAAPEGLVYTTGDEYIANSGANYLYFIKDDDSFCATVFSRDGSFVFGTQMNPRSQLWPTYSPSPDLFDESICENYMTISRYWKVIDYAEDLYGVSFTYFAPYKYEKPSFEILCDPEELNPGETSTCFLNIISLPELYSISFKLDTDKYDIIDIIPGEKFENLTELDGKYSLTKKEDTFHYSDTNSNAETNTLITFTLKNNNNVAISSPNNVKALDIEYVDAVGNSSSDEIATTVKQNPKNNSNNKTSLLKNPLTNTIAIDVLLILGIIGIGSLIILKVKKKRNA